MKVNVFLGAIDTILQILRIDGVLISGIPVLMTCFCQSIRISFYSGNIWYRLKNSAIEYRHGTSTVQMMMIKNCKYDIQTHFSMNDQSKFRSL
jgi:hypothetical protein